MDLQGYDVGYWNCMFVLIGMMVLWRGLAVLVLICKIKRVTA